MDPSGRRALGPMISSVLDADGGGGRNQDNDNINDNTHDNDNYNYNGTTTDGHHRHYGNNDDDPHQEGGEKEQLEAITEMTEKRGELTKAIEKLAKDVSAQCREDKRAWMVKLLDTAAAAYKNGNVEAAFKAYKALKPWKPSSNNAVKKSDGTFARDGIEARARWLEYFEEQVQGKTTTLEELTAANKKENVARWDRQGDSTGPPMDLHTVVRRCAAMKARKATGEDLIPPDICRASPLAVASFWMPISRKVL